MNFWFALSLAALCLIATIIIFATKMFFPHHRVVALFVYAVGWIPFIYAILLQKRFLQQHQEVVSTFLQAFWIHITFGIVLILSLYIFLTIFPAEKSPFIGMDEGLIKQRIDEDRSVLMYVEGNLEHVLESIQNEKTFAADFDHISNSEKEAIQKAWFSYIESMVTLDVLKERYKTFYQLNSITQPELHRLAFETGYAAFLAQHYYTLQFVEEVKDPNLKSYLNQRFSEMGIEKGTFDLIEDNLTNSSELLRLNTGRAYYSTLQDEDSLLYTSIKKYLHTIDSSLEVYADMLVKKPLNALERNSYKVWFPIQKQSAIQISYIKTSTRDYFITPKQIAAYKNKLLPGDIFLERREWHATNVGIPGFWTHNALYVGTLKDLDEYFAELPELEGATFSQYLENTFPSAYALMVERDDRGYEHSVIESKRPGVIMTSLEYTGNADSLAVLRPKGLEKSDRFKVVTQAIGYLGKPYDFDFDFVTDNALVCSELIYKAYQDVDKLRIELQEMNGRPILSPNQFAEKFAHEYQSNGSELELVLFLDGNEKDRVAVEKGEEEFSETWQRPKWHIAKDFVNFQ
jgi:hypothetical protein